MNELASTRKTNTSPFGFRSPLHMAFGARTAGRGCLLTFHRVAPATVWSRLPNRNFYIDLDFLDRLLAHLRRRRWKIVTIGEALEQAQDPTSNVRFVNFSIDDGYRDNYELLVPLFRKHGAPITLYVTTGIPDRTIPMWWAGLEDTLFRRDRVVVDGQTIDVGSNEARRRRYAEIEAVWSKADPAQHYRTFCADNHVDDETIHSRHALSWKMLEELRGDPLVEIGSHGSMHLRIASLSAEDALAELKSGRQRLMDRLGVDIRHYAFPYGRSTDCGFRDFELARVAGFASAATTRKGLIRYAQDPFQLPRNTLNGAHRSLAAVELHLAGITGVAARMLGRA
jgi:peptidoglycan/xylan/chitin deacetylase (PgdA/CDA1 family)